MRRIRLVREYFWPHARASLRQIGLTERHVNARRTLRWIRARRKNEISLEDVRRDALGQKLDAEQTATLLEVLTRSGWVRELSAFSTPKGGRPPRRWQINPQIGVLVAETAETAQTPRSHDELDPSPEVSAVSAVSASQSVFTANGDDDPLPERGDDDLDDGLGGLRRCVFCNRPLGPKRPRRSPSRGLPASMGRQTGEDTR